MSCISNCITYLQTGGSTSEIEQTREFAEWLLQVGDGKVGDSNDGEVEFRLPNDVIIRNTDDLIAKIVKSTYPLLLPEFGKGEYFQDRAILAPTNEMFKK